MFNFLLTQDSPQAQSPSDEKRCHKLITMVFYYFSYPLPCCKEMLGLNFPRTMRVFMDFYVFMRTQPWPAELWVENRSLDCSSVAMERAGCTHSVTTCYAQPMGLCLIDSLVPIQAMLLNSLATVLFSFWPEPLF